MTKEELFEKIANLAKQYETENGDCIIGVILSMENDDTWEWNGGNNFINHPEYYATLAKSDTE